MIVVSGTRRAGTSMWMQILDAAGLPTIGERFPGNWHDTLREANPHGFYESLLRHGVFYRTNPHPATGEYVRPEEVRRHAVKIFIPGLIRSDVSFLDHVVVTVRSWREYVASMQRMHALEDAQLEDDRARRFHEALRMPPALEWWDEHFALIRDLSIRRYACHVQSYDGVLADPAGVLARTFEWLGLEVDVAAIVAAVHPEARTQHAPPCDAVPPDVAEVFDAFYAAVHTGAGLDAELIARMNATHARLQPEIAEHRERIARARGLPVLPSALPDDGPFAVLEGEWA